MRPLDQLSAESLKNIKIVCFDCDGVINQKGTDLKQNGSSISLKTNFPTPSVLEKLSRLKNKYHLCINSGRSSLYLTQIFNSLLWDNVSLVSEIGIFILQQGQIIQTDILDDYELAVIKKIRTELGRLIGDPRVKGFEPKQYLTTLHCFSEVPEVAEILAKNDPERRFYCWWNQEAYDINSSKFNKGKGLKKLLEIHHLNESQLLTVGNGINDQNMTTSTSINISTDPSHLQSDDFFVEGEHLGGEKVIDYLLAH